MIAIRPIAPADEAAWRDMWGGYCDFYRATVAPQVTDATWARFFQPGSGIHGLIAEQNGKAVGFAAYVLHPYTWGANPVCYLEDLFVRPEARGHDVGHRLISELVAQAKNRGWDRVYWHTERGNDRARRLYDRFSPADDFVRYRIAID